MDVLIVDLAPWGCLLCGILMVGFLFGYLIKNIYVGRNALLDKRMEHEKAVKKDEWERKVEWENLISSAYRCQAVEEMRKELKERDEKIKELELKLEKETQLNMATVTLLALSLSSDKESMEVEKIEAKVEGLRKAHKKIKEYLK